jgi:hypothetical protein
MNTTLLSLLNKITHQIANRKSQRQEVELLALLDNKRCTIGQKHQNLLNLAQGRYISYIHDDDDISDEYVDSILAAIDANPEVDVITFMQSVKLENRPIVMVDFGRYNENQEISDCPTCTRKPFPCCVWRTSIAKTAIFPNISYGEDWVWAERALRAVRTEIHLDKCLHHYRWSKTISEADNTAK